MKILLAIALAGSIYGQTKNYNLNAVFQGSVNATGATSTRPFREVLLAPSGACTVAGEIVSVVASPAIYKCPSNTMTWELITGSGESITATSPIVRTGDALSCPTCITTSSTTMNSLANIGVILSGVWQATRVALPYGGTSSDLSATGPGYLKQATLGAPVTVAYPAYSELTGIPSTFAPSAHASSHQHGGSDAIATATPGANVIPKAGSDSKLASGFMTEVISLTDLSDVASKQGNSSKAAMANGSFTAGNAVTTDSSGNLIDSGVTPGATNSVFSAITSGTNTAAAMVCGSGCSLAATGSGSIGATTLASLGGLPSIADQRLLGNVSGSSAAPAAITPANLATMMLGGFTVANWSDLRVTASGTSLTVGAGKYRCGDIVYSVASPVTITLSSGTAGSDVIINCLAAGTSNAIVINTTNTVTGTGFASTTAASSTYYNKQMLASVTVSGSNWGTVTDLRTIGGAGGIVASTGLTCDSDANGLPRCGIDSTVLTKGTAIPVTLNIPGSGSGSALQDSDDIADVWRNTTGGSITINTVYCRANSGAPTVQLQKDDGGLTNMFVSSLSCGTSEGNTSTFVTGENILANGDYLKFITVSASAGGGSPTQVALSFSYTRN